MTAFLFAGQGSQYAGMGRDLFDDFPEHVDAADRVLGYSIGDLCTGGDARLNDTRFAQPALYVVGVLEYLAFQRACDEPPSYLLGHSLGEYCALHVAGAFDFETGLELVKQRGAVMAEACSGAMAAVIGLTADAAQEALASFPGDGLWIANYNAPEQVVLSGTHEAVAAAEAHFRACGATAFVPLKVSGPFHCPLMSPAAERFAATLEAARVAAPTVRVVANAHAKFYTHESVRRYLLDQIAAPVRWVDGIELLLRRGETRFVDLGKKKTLFGLMEKLLRSN